MTVDSAQEAIPDARSRRRALSPLLTIRVVQVVLWLFVISGPVAALLVATQMSSIGCRLDSLGALTSVEVPPDTAGVEGFADLFIAAYLGASENSTDVLTLFLGGVALDGVQAGSWSAIGTTSLGAEEVSPGYYAVVVATQVAAGSESDGQTVWVPVGTRYFSVGVTETATGWAVTGLPALIPPPAKAAVPELLVERFDGLASLAGLEEMLPRFFAGFLTGVGELTRYTSPSASIVAVHPPPYTGVEVLRAGRERLDQPQAWHLRDHCRRQHARTRGHDRDGLLAALDDLVLG